MVCVWAAEDEAAATRARAFYEDRVALPLRVLEDRLADRRFILGDRCSVIVGYALIALDWSVLGGVSLAPADIRAHMPGWRTGRSSGMSGRSEGRPTGRSGMPAADLR